ILRGCNRYAAIFESLKVPLVGLGLGIEARHADNQAVLDGLVQRAEFILVRDRASAQRLGDHPKVLVAPDLTFLYPFHVVPWREEDVCALSLRPWHFWRGEYWGKWDKFMRRLSRRVPRFEAVYPLAKWSPARAVGAVRRHFQQVIPLPLGCASTLENDVGLLRRFFPDVPGEFRPELLGRSRYLVGMRLHSLIFACQMGVPFVSLSYQPKNAAFCADIGLGPLSVDIYRQHELEEAIEGMRQRSARWREHLIVVRQENVRVVWRAVVPLLKELGVSVATTEAA
ncbi:MAG TPA: hypothetical protein EYP56_21900, partial [Planctomycetaceae bacterium]|nr:hypothetical protein [Planctomycetaceae bacterium]